MDAEWKGQREAKTVAVIMATVILISIGFGIFHKLTGPFQIASLRADGDLSIDIIGVPDPGFDTAPALYYEVRKSNSIVVDRHYCWVPYDRTNRKDYRLLVLDGGSLIAVYEQSTPHCLSVLYDATTGEHYPCVGDCALPAKVSGDHLDALRDRLVGRVIALTKDERYKSADQYVVGRDD